MTDVYDSPWQVMGGRYFRPLLEFFFPNAHDDIDWDRGHESLDKDLPKLLRTSESRSRRADKLIRVTRKGGDEQIVLVHIEFQNDHDVEFPERMFTYNYRAYDLYKKPVVSLAILGDDSARWRPSSYAWDVWGCRMGLVRFPVVKLWDYNGRWDELEESVNPCATVVMAHLRSRQTRHDPERRLRWKTRLVRRLYELGYQRQEVVDLFRFIDWVMELPEELETRFEENLQRLKSETNMEYISRYERRSHERGFVEGEKKGLVEGEKKGLSQGLRQGEAAVLKRQLTRRFGDLPGWAEDRLETAPVPDLESWSERVLDAGRLEDVFEDPSPEP